MKSIFLHDVILQGGSGYLLFPVGSGEQAVFFPSGDPETDDIAPSTTTGQLPYPGQLGMRATIVEPGRTPATAYGKGRSKTYQLIQTDSTMATAPFPNAVAWWSDKTRYLVTTSVTKLGRGRIAGRFPDNGAGGSITKGNWGWIQVGGPGMVKFVDAPTAAPSAVGLFVIPSATDGKADCLAAGSQPTYPTLGTSASGLNPAYAAGPNDNCGVVDLDVSPSTT